jgi:hypothetical protein
MNESENQALIGAVSRREPENESSLRIHPAQQAELIQDQGVAEQKRIAPANFTRKREEHERNLDQGVKIPQRNTEQTKHIRIGLRNLFKNEINPIVTKTIPEENGCDG